VLTGRLAVRDLLSVMDIAIETRDLTELALVLGVRG
jgi:hypothetical protein